MREPRHTINRTLDAPAKSATLPSPLKVIVSTFRGILEGALPLVILIGILALFWEVLTIVRIVTVSNGFLFTQQAEMYIAEGGLVISLIVFLVAGMRTLRGVRDRHSEGEYVEPTVTLVVLAISLLVLAISVWMTIGIPQHPAP